jgi:hypothetical protein
MLRQSGGRPNDLRTKTLRIERWIGFAPALGTLPSASNTFATTNGELAHGQDDAPSKNSKGA